MQVKFITILTDLNALWKVISTTHTHMVVVEQIPELPPKKSYRQLSDEDYSRAVAVMHIQTALAEAAASLMARRKELFPGEFCSAVITANQLRNPMQHSF